MAPWGPWGRRKGPFWMFRPTRPDQILRKTGLLNGFACNCESFEEVGLLGGLGIQGAFMGSVHRSDSVIG